MSDDQLREVCVDMIDDINQSNSIQESLEIFQRHIAPLLDEARLEGALSMQKKIWSALQDAEEKTDEN